MKTAKRFTILIITAIAIVAITSISLVAAYMFKRSSELENQFTPAIVQCDVVENFDTEGKASEKTSVKVKNTSNIDAYIRLRVVMYWQDSKGNPVGRTSPENKFGGDWKYDTENWIYDEAEQTFYYKKTVSPEASTLELFAKDFDGIRLEAKDEEFDGQIYTYHPVIEFIAEAIQSKPTDAVLSWDVTLDSSGNISGLK